MAYPCLERNHRLSLRSSLRNQALELRHTGLARDECDLSSGHDQLKTTIPGSPPAFLRARTRVQHFEPVRAQSDHIDHGKILGLEPDGPVLVEPVEFH